MALGDEPTQTVIELPKRKRPPPGVRIQVLLGLAVVALFAVISTGTLSLWAAADGLRQQREATASALVATGASAIAAAVDPGQALSAPSQTGRIAPLVRHLLEAGRLAEVSVVDSERHVVFSRPPRDMDDQDPPVALAALAGVPLVLHYRRDKAGPTQLLAYAPVTNEGRVLGLLRVVLEAPPPMLGFLAQSGAALALLALGNAVLLVALGYLLITSLVVRPLRQVERAIANLASGGPGQSVRVEGPKELITLGESFNQMAASLTSQREQLIRTEKLASVGQLAAGVAHEIGNPLAAILGYADLLRQDGEHPGDLAPAERQDIATRISVQTQRIHRTISDLLEYSRPNVDRPGPSDALTAVKAARDLVLAMGSRVAGLRIQVASADDARAWPLVQASAERIQQVMVNLFLNAADATTAEGSIIVTPAVSDGRLLIQVADDGPGVPPHLRRRIFDPFFTTKEPGRGTGLGLPICRAILESAGGRLELDQNTGGPGAAFVVTLPLANVPLERSAES